MPYRYLEEIATADVAFEAWGASWEEMFAAAADALMNVMVADLSSITAVQRVPIDLEHEAVDLLLFDFLQELVFLKDARRLLLRVPNPAISRGEETLTLHAVAEGEEIDPQRHDLRVDVKAVTFYRFEVVQRDAAWYATVILDI
ncbi:archease [Geobacter sp.]|uniref:archease n=1 Tax=Geobacter sp. TaxID=46610 RepID=UPI00260187E8|nr:archease [Geobacter sp.]